MKRKSLVLLFPFLLGSCSCKKENSLGPSPVPYVSVNVMIETSLPEYSALNFEGGYIYYPGGNKGLIILQDFLGNFMAFDRTCPYHINSPCGIVCMDHNGPDIVCGSYPSARAALDTCCKSMYNLEGSVIHGPSTYPLKTYNVTVSGTVPDVSLHITN